MPYAGPQGLGARRCLPLLEEALRATRVTGWRFDRVTYHSVRVDLTSDESAVQGETGEHDVETVVTEMA